MATRVSEPSFQSLFTEMKTGDVVLASGTSFVVTGPMGKFFLLTARHNLTGRHQKTNEPLCKKTGGIPDTLVVWHNAKSELGHFIPVSLPLLRDGHRCWIEHPTLGAQADIAAIPLLATDAVDLYPYKAEHLAHMEIEPAQPVSVVGFSVWRAYRSILRRLGNRIRCIRARDRSWRGASVPH
jgi:hypothetical protein